MDVVPLALISIPTAVIPIPWFTRMTPVRPQDYLMLAITVLFAAALGAAYALPARCPLQPGRLAVCRYLSVLAVGCPICNKIVVLLLGVSGALTYFQPIQPLLSLGSMALLGYTLVARRRTVGAFARGGEGS